LPRVLSRSGRGPELLAEIADIYTERSQLEYS
jgi:hypothetical protein